MSMEISRTPTLKGKEAEKFQNLANANRKKYAPKEEVVRAINTFVSVYRKGIINEL